MYELKIIGTLEDARGACEAHGCKFVRFVKYSRSGITTVLVRDLLPGIGFESWKQEKDLTGALLDHEEIA